MLLHERIDFLVLFWGTTKTLPDRFPLWILRPFQARWKKSSLSNAGSFPSWMYSQKDSASICNVTGLVTTGRLWVQLRGKQLVDQEVSHLFTTTTHHSQPRGRSWLNHGLWLGSAGSHPGSFTPQLKPKLTVSKPQRRDSILRFPNHDIPNMIGQRSSKRKYLCDLTLVMQEPAGSCPQNLTVRSPLRTMDWKDMYKTTSFLFYLPTSCLFHNIPNRIRQESNTSPSKNIFDFLSDVMYTSPPLVAQEPGGFISPWSCRISYEIQSQAFTNL